jgi:hypothetical protein
MRKLNHLQEQRVKLFGDSGDEYNGAFKMKIKGELYTVIAANGNGWDHVSISHKHKIPSWKVMCILKDLFFEEHENVMQLHPAAADHINIDPNCLHLWRPQNEGIPLPPKNMV